MVMQSINLLFTVFLLINRLPVYFFVGAAGAGLIEGAAQLEGAGLFFRALTRTKKTIFSGHILAYQDISESKT